MTDLGTPAPELNQPLAGLAPNAATHYRLWFFAAVSQLVAVLARRAASFSEVFEDFPFLVPYADELADHGLAGIHIEAATARWCDSLGAWEDAAPGPLPLRALRRALDLGTDEMLLLMAAALPEEDARFGALFSQLHDSPGARRPTLGLLASWWGEAAAVHRGVQGLMQAGMLTPADAALPRAEWPLAIPPLLWDAMRGECPAHPAPWAHHRPWAGLPALADLVLNADALTDARAVCAAWSAGQANSLIVRGPRANGRRTLLAACAQALGLGVLEIQADDGAWPAQLAGPLATLLGALPVLVLQAAPGQTVQVPALPGRVGALGIVLEGHGGVAGPGVQHPVQIELELPLAAQRRQLWQRALGEVTCPPLHQLAEAWRLGSGQILRLAALSLAGLQVQGGTALGADGVRRAARQLQREALDTVAVRLRGGGGWASLAVPPETRAELDELQRRCRHRERLPQPGVRALFKGGSGTGKSMAARLLADELGKDIYRLDLAAVVNKYIGETEKNLDRALRCAEALDVVLLLDEGDALLARRTDVGNANDRYANLETNFLLQRLESHGGILVITTNASERIDSAFTRRLDIVIDFPMPQAEQRLAIWALHLPTVHTVSAEQLREVAQRCALSGGQIRNAAQQALLLALDRDGPLGDADLLQAVRREYRKTGGLCPLRAAA